MYRCTNVQMRQPELFVETSSGASVCVILFVDLGNVIMRAESAAADVNGKQPDSEWRFQSALIMDIMRSIRRGGTAWIGVGIS